MVINLEKMDLTYGIRKVQLKVKKMNHLSLIKVRLRWIRRKRNVPTS